MPLRVPTRLTALTFVLFVATACDDGGGTGGSGGTGSTSTAGSTTGSASSSSAATTATSTGATTTSSSSTGGQAGCTQGDTMPCYTADPATKGIGLCKAGVSTCDASGAFGACVGEVTPSLETCATPDDEDCDGLVNEEGAGCVCVPNATSACYTGDPATQNVGACADGTATCDALGTSLGACTGDVLPTIEDCLLPDDEDCDGTSTTCTGDPLFAKGFGDFAQQRATAVAARGGEIVLGGGFAGVVDFGLGTLVSNGGNDAYVARFDALGAPVWNKRFGNGADQIVNDVAIDDQGNVLVIGDFNGSIDLGGGPLMSAGGTDVFVAKFDAGGTLLWAKRLGDPSTQNGRGIAVDATGNVFITGAFAGTVDFGGGAMMSVGATDAFVVALDANGGFVWGRRFGDAAAQVGVALAVTPTTLFVAGDAAGSVDLGSGSLTSAGSTDVFVASLDAPSGTPMGGTLYGNASAQNAGDIAVRFNGANAEVVLVGTFAGTINLGSGVLTSSGAADGFVALIGASSWSKRIGGSTADAARSVAVDANGAVVVGGDFALTADLGGGAVMSAGGLDAYVVKFDPMGNHVWSHHYGNGADQSVTAVATDVTDIYVAGNFMGQIDLGLGPINSGGLTDILFARLAP
ncbi:MAG: SBBP repeat-containing protein [Polyangiaceae bacterium]